MSMSDVPDQIPSRPASFIRRVIRYWSLNPVVSTDVIAGRALLSVVAILTFLTALSAGAAQLVMQTTSSWQASIISEVTIQIKPEKSRDIDADMNAIAEFIRPLSGIKDVRLYTQEESAKLLRPWLGEDVSFDQLPIPRMIAIAIDKAKPFDQDIIRAELETSFPNAVLDDHRDWMERLGLMSGIVAASAGALMILVIFATAMAIAFATRGTMAGNRDIIEVLHFIGASDSYIAGEFQRYFARLGLIGGIYGGLGALIVLTLLKANFAVMTGVDLLSSSEALSIGWLPMAAMSGVVVLVTCVAALVSRITVHRTIGRLI